MTEPSSDEISICISVEFAQLNGLKYTDNRALFDTVTGVTAYMDGYMQGIYESMNTLKPMFPDTFCRGLAESADKLIQEKQNKRQQ